MYKRRKLTSRLLFCTFIIAASAFLSFLLQSHFISALTVVFVNSKSLSSLKIDDTPVDDPSLKVLVANNSDTLKLLKMSSCPHVSPAGTVGAVTPVGVLEPKKCGAGRIFSI